MQPSPCQAVPPECTACKGDNGARALQRCRGSKKTMSCLACVVCTEPMWNRHTSQAVTALDCRALNCSSVSDSLALLPPISSTSCQNLQVSPAKQVLSSTLSPMQRCKWRSWTVTGLLEHCLTLTVSGIPPDSASVEPG